MDAVKSESNIILISVWISVHLKQPSAGYRGTVPKTGGVFAQEDSTGWGVDLDHVPRRLVHLRQLDVVFLQSFYIVKGIS